MKRNYLKAFVVIAFVFSMGCGQQQVYQPDKEFAASYAVFLAEFDAESRSYKIWEIYKNTIQLPTDLIIGRKIKMPGGDRESLGSPLRLIFILPDTQHFDAGPYLPRAEIPVKDGYISAYRMTLDAYRQQTVVWSRKQ